MCHALATTYRCLPSDLLPDAGFDELERWLFNIACAQAGGERLKELRESKG